MVGHYTHVRLSLFATIGLIAVRLSTSSRWRSPLTSVPVLLALVLAACSGGAGSSVAATVGDAEITVAEVDAAYANRAEASGVASELAGDESGAVEENLKAQVLTNLIRVEVLRQAAEDRNIEVSDEEIAEQRERLVEEAGGEEALQQVLDESNVSDEELQGNLRDQVIQNKITEQLTDDVTDEEVRAAFEEDPQGQFGPKVEVRHILTENRADAREAIDRIESGEDFADVARDVSVDTTSAQNGGDLGQVPRGATVPAFEKAAFNAETGELVGPVESQFGFHVLEVTDEVAAADFADVEGEIRSQLESAAGGQAFNEYITEFVSGLQIEVDEQYGAWDDTTVSVVPEQPATGSEAPSAAPLPTDLPSDLSSEQPTR